MKDIYKNYTSTQFDLTKATLTKETIREGFALLDYLYGKFLPSNNNGKILDFGCGFGRVVYWLTEKGYSNVSGVDLSESQTKLAHELGIENVVYGNAIEYLNSSEGGFELIMAIDVMEHLDKEEGLRFLELANQKLVPGGTLLLQYPNPEGLHFNSIYFGDVTHKAAYTAKAIYQLGMLANFSKITVYPVRPVKMKLAGKIRFILWRIRELISTFWMVVERGRSTKYFTSNIIITLEKTK